MNLQDIFDALTHGELSQLAIGGGVEIGQERAGIDEEDRPQVISHIQLGLTALYKRFRLHERSVGIELQEDKNLYVLDSALSKTHGTSSAPRYLLDDEDPFDNALLKVEEVFAQRPGGAINPLTGYFNEDEPLSLNKRNDPHSVRTTSMNVLVLPDQLMHHLRNTLTTSPVVDKLRVVYRANHPKIDPIIGQSSPESQPIGLPTSHLQALLYYVGSRVHNPIGMTDEFHAGNSYYAKYENECQRLESDGYQIDDIGMETKFERAGFM